MPSECHVRSPRDIRQPKHSDQGALNRVGSNRAIGRSVPPSTARSARISPTTGTELEAVAGEPGGDRDAAVAARQVADHEVLVGRHRVHAHVVATQLPCSAGIRSARTARIAATSSGATSRSTSIRIGGPTAVVEADLGRPAADVGDAVEGVARGHLPDECREAIRARTRRDGRPARRDTSPFASGDSGKPAPSSFAAHGPRRRRDGGRPPRPASEPHRRRHRRRHPSRRPATRSGGRRPPLAPARGRP